MTFPEPSWARLGFPEPPDPVTSGEGVGIVILDKLDNPQHFRHLGSRLNKISVNDDLSVSCSTFCYDHSPLTEFGHGDCVLQLLAQRPFEFQGKVHVGISPAATFYLLDETDPLKIKKGLEWVVQKKNEWNIKIVLNLSVPSPLTLFQPSFSDPLSQALLPVIESDLLVVAANGNSKAHINLHPIEFFTVGGFDDHGSHDPENYRDHPVVPFGLNGDGHFRPDVSAPFDQLPVAMMEEELVYFSGSCGSSSLVAGVCAYMFSIFPELDNETLKYLLTVSGFSLKESENQAMTVHVQRAAELLKSAKLPVNKSSSIKINPGNCTISSKNPIERTLAMTGQVHHHILSRERLWELVHDESPLVCKNAILALSQTTLHADEKEEFWSLFHLATNQGEKNGIKERLLYALLEQATSEDLDKWMELVKDENIDAWLCLRLYLQKFYPSAPNMTHESKPDPSITAKESIRLMDWYQSLDSFNTNQR
ncbi:S8/S53 family peptidase [Falsibacillus albus]|uniref:S8 family serine peptidase n=1 Tax=Falsibacillus albus TaxID=2478915 RepID=UPI0011E5DC67|nr:S8 family serine peptidase [Falsibacillus albus]